MIVTSVNIISWKNKSNQDLSYIKYYKYNKIKYFTNQYLELLKN